MIKSIYQPTQQNFMHYIKNGSFIYNITQGIPLFLWVVFLYKFKMNPKYISKLLGNKILDVFFYIIISIPFIVYAFTVYETYIAPNPLKKVSDATAAAMPHGWEYCFSSKVNSDNINKSILGFLDDECIENNQSVFRSKAIDMLNRYHYLNYILLLLIITFRWHTKYIKVKFNTIQCHVIGYSILFGVIATIIPLFSTYLIRGMWIIQTMSVLLTMNISCFILIVLSFLKDFV